MPFADDVTAVDSAATWRSSIEDGGVTSQTGGTTPAAKLWSLPDARRARVINALKGMDELHPMAIRYSAITVVIKRF